MTRETWKQLAWQAAGWWLTALALAWAHALAGLPLWAAGAILTLVILKDLAVLPLLRHLRAPASAVVAAGAHGTAVDTLDPRGYVRIAGELWRAEARGAAIVAGTEVVVRARRGLTLVVEHAGPRG
jgi:membrane-bound ClpP family serine protease